MKREKTTSSLCFCMLSCAASQVTFVNWLCGTNPVSNVVLPIIIGQTKQETFLLALTGRNQRSMIGKGMVTLSRSFFFYPNLLLMTQGAYHSCLVEILMITIVESIKGSNSKQLPANICACFISLASSSPFFVGFAVESLLAVSL